MSRKPRTQMQLVLSQGTLIKPTSEQYTCSKYFQHITINTHGDRVLDHCYTSFRDAYKSLPRPPFGKSDHSFVLLLPAYRQKLKREAPALRIIQCWSDQSDAILQDCFDHVDWDMFRAASDDDTEAYSDTVTSGSI